MSRHPCSTLQLHIYYQLYSSVYVEAPEVSLSCIMCNLHSGATPRGRAGSDAASAVLTKMGRMKASEDTCFFPILNVERAIGA